MTLELTRTQKLDKLSDSERNTFNRLTDIEKAYNYLINQVSNKLANKNCYIDYNGLNEYKSYHKDSLKIIHDISLDLALETYSNEYRRKGRSLLTIILNELGGALGELTAAYDYGMEWNDFIKQFKEKKTYTPYDLLIRGKKVEVKTVSYKFLYDKTETAFPVDTANNYKHPKYWKVKEGGFDFTALCYVWKGRFRLMKEVSWFNYYFRRIHYSKSSLGFLEKERSPGRKTNQGSGMD